MRQFLKFVGQSQGSKILDIGGTAMFWANAGDNNLQVTLLNQDESAANHQTPSVRRLMIGDACAMSFTDREFDIAFSNSVIEHVGTWERQRAFAREVTRTGKRVWVQTPAREFPIEPHLLAPFVHWFPRRWQRHLIPWATLRGWVERWSSAEADAFLNEVRLLTIEEMRILFPDCTIHRERFLGLTKSYIALSTVHPIHEPPRAD